MKQYLSKQNRALLLELVRTDFKLRYQGSILGYAWSLLKPLLLFMILYVVFVYFLNIGKGVPHYPVYLLLGIVLWNFFNEMTSQSLTAIVNRGDLIRKIKIPRWIIVFATSIGALINLLLNLVIVGILLVINQVDFSYTMLLLPLNILVIYVFGLGISLFLSAVFVKYRDMSYIWEVVLQAGFYATPIIYPLTMIHIELVQKLLLMNPIAMAIQDARFNVVTHEALTANQVFESPLYMILPYIISIIVFIVGSLYFKRKAKYFAEDL